MSADEPFNEKFYRALIANSPAGRIATILQFADSVDRRGGDSKQVRHHLQCAQNYLDMGHDARCLVELADARNALSLIGWDMDPDRERGAKIKAGASGGGKATAAQRLDEKTTLFAEMQRLIAAGKSVSAAAHIAASKGFGSSAAANRQRWIRRKSTES